MHPNEPPHYSYKRLIYSVVITLLLLILPWAVEIAFLLGGPDWKDFGLRPWSLSGFLGTFTMPFLHSGINHLLSNSIPFFVLASGLFYFYRESSWRVILGLVLGTGVILWFIGRPGTNHIGASGLVYGLVAFHLTGGLIRKNRNLMAFSLLVVFLYGGFIWSLFPDFFPDQNISWEGHLAGLISGVVIAFLCRRCGPQPDPMLQDDEDEPEEEETETEAPVDNVSSSVARPVRYHVT